MPSFHYTAVDSQGQKVAGIIEADARPAALRQIQDKGLAPVEVASTDGPAVSKSAPRRALSKKAAEDFSRELANLLGAGIPMSRALNVLCRQSRSSSGSVLESIHNDVTAGGTLADAMSNCPGSFSRVQIAMVHAGETGGFLDVVLSQIADFQNRERDLKGRISSAMAYPLVLAGVATAVLTFLLTYFIPKFSEMFTELGGSLPALTRGIVGLSNIVVHRGPIALAVVLLGVWLLRRYARSDAGRLRYQKAILGAPGIGRIAARLALVRFTRMLGTLIASGVPLVAALRVSREAVGNEVLSEAMRNATEDVVRGRSLSRSLQSCESLFPLAVIESLAVAEEAGRLDKELLRLAEVYEKDLDLRLRVAVSMAEPLILFVMATLIGMIVIGMLLPIFSIQELIK
jgi:type II secretory pathway component PulF